MLWFGLFLSRSHNKVGHSNIWSTSIKNFILSQIRPGMSLWNIAAVIISEYHKRHLDRLIQQLDL